MARHGENIRHRKTDGRWEGRYPVFDAVTGTKRYRSVYGHSYEEVKEKLTTQKDLLRNGSLAQMQCRMPECGVIFEHLVSEWIENVRKEHKYSTGVKYETVYRKHIAKFLGQCTLSMFDSAKLQSEISGYFTMHSFSESTQKSIYCVANQILRYANERYSTSFSLLKNQMIKRRKKPVEPFSKTEQARMIESLTEGPAMDSFKLVTLLCMYTGMRLGELCALKWTDVDFDNLTINVNCTVQRIAVEGMNRKTCLLETAPKSDSSVRKIPVHEELLKLLIPFRDTRPYIFGGDKPMEPRAIQYRFKKLLKQVNVTDRNFHTLRHTFATNCIENGMDVKSLSEILGHSDVRITLNRYVHPTMDAKREQIEKLLDYYGRICGQVA